MKELAESFVLFRGPRLVSAWMVLPDLGHVVALARAEVVAVWRASAAVWKISW